MGWDDEVSICNAVLRLPQDSEMLDEYITICAKRPVPLNVPWYSLRERILRQIKRLSHTVQGKMIAPLLGPVTLTHLVHKHGLTGHVKPRPVFYPAPYGRENVARMGEPGYFERHTRDRDRSPVAVHVSQGVRRRDTFRLAPQAAFEHPLNGAPSDMRF